MQRIADVDRETHDPVEFLEALKLDLEQDEVYVFTPKGRVIALPASSTPVDFAYAIHTEVGHRCIGARVNGRLVPLDTTLTSADTVEIFTSKSPTAGPSRDWLQIVASSRARNKIRQWFSRERREDAIENGREELARALRREGMPLQNRPRVERPARRWPVDEPGRPRRPLRGHRREPGVGPVDRPAPGPRAAGRRATSSCRPPPPAGAAARAGRDSTAGVYVEGLDDVMVHLARCCTPVPGDQIVGFVTQGRGVSVHRADCSNATRPGAALPGAAHRGRVGPRRATASSWPPWRSWPSTGPACWPT